MWAFFDNEYPSKYLNIDLGKISEDIIPNRKLDAEDKNHNGKLDAGEDTGIDGLPDQSETGYNSKSNPDPNQDDYKTDNFINYNAELDNTENNKKLDSEDLNGNGNLDLVNSYYTYKIPLTYQNNPYTVGEKSRGWWIKLKVKLVDYSGAIGNPQKNGIEKLRLWVGGLTKPIEIRIAEIKFNVK